MSIPSSIYKLYAFHQPITYYAHQNNRGNPVFQPIISQKIFELRQNYVILGFHRTTICQMYREIMPLLKWSGRLMERQTTIVLFFEK